MLKTIEVDAHGGIRLLQPSPKAQEPQALLMLVVPKPPVVQKIPAAFCGVVHFSNNRGVSNDN
jgi:hypothetical protein